MGLDQLRGLLARLRALRRDDQELQSELQFHLEHLTDQLVSQGVPIEEAARRARVELGGATQIKESCRDESGANQASDFFRDALFAIRKFRSEPGFALAAVFTLALGIGLNMALFTVLYAVIFRPLPVKDPNTLRNVYVDPDAPAERGEAAAQAAGPEMRSSYGSKYFVSFAELQFLKQHSKTADLAGTAEASLSLRGPSPASLHAQLVSANLIAMMGGVPVAGRFFSSDETAVAILSHAAWNRHFQSDPGIVGRTIILNRTPFTVVGVANAGFHGPLTIVPDVWIPLSMQPITRPGESLVDDPNAAFVQVFARPRSGYDPRSVTAEMSVLAQQAFQAHGSTRTTRVHVVRAAFLNYPDVMGVATPGLLVIALAGGMILLVACANVANLLLARGLSRRREIAIRLAVGAGRFRLMRQMVTESLLLGLAGGCAGLLLAWQGGTTALKFVPASVGQVQLDASPDPWVLFFALLLSIAAALACGVLPALQALRVDLSPALKSEGLLDSHAGGKNRLQNRLVGLQVAVSVILLVNAGLVLRGFQRAGEMDTGREMHGLLIASFDLRQQQYTAEKALRFHEQLAETLSALPQVPAVSVSLLEPELSSYRSVASAADGPKGQQVSVSFDETGPDYFRAAGIPIRQGRSFTAAEVKSHAKVGLVDEDLARMLFGGNAIGKWVGLPGPPDAPAAQEKFEVIGVTGRTKSLAPGPVSPPSYYVPMQGMRYMEAKLWIRYRGALAGVVQALRAAVNASDPEVTFGVHTIEENVKTALTPVLIASWAASVTGGLALALAAIGLYGIVSFAVNRRLREMGVRMALGARGRDVMRAVFAQLPGSLGIGLVAGMAGAIGLGSLIRAVLYGVSPVDPVALVGVMGLLAMVGVVASWIPARRAVRVDPASVLRNE